MQAPAMLSTAWRPGLNSAALRARRQLHRTWGSVGFAPAPWYCDHGRRGGFPIGWSNPPRPVLAAPRICQWLARRSSRPAHTEPLPQTESLVRLPWKAKLSGHPAASLQPYMVLRFPGKAKLISLSGLGVDPPSRRTPLLLAKHKMPTAGLRGWMASSSPGLKLNVRS